jgi:hypothetical protein
VTPEEAAALRAPFAPELVGKLPRIWCGACRDARSKVCSAHTKTRCDECQNKITDAHLHLDYVGHADVTDRLLQVDPLWTWEPMALTVEGLPAFGNGGLWIRMTVCGVVRIGFGDAPGKSGGDGVKEVVGDAIRNAALRFGVAIDLWRREKPAPDDGGTAPKPTPRRNTRSSTKDTAPKLISEPQLRKLMALMNEAGIVEREQRLGYCVEVVGRPLGSSKDLTQQEAGLVIETLETAANEPREEDPA